MNDYIYRESKGISDFSDEAYKRTHIGYRVCFHVMLDSIKKLLQQGIQIVTIPDSLSFDTTVKFEGVKEVRLMIDYRNTKQKKGDLGDV